MSEFIGVVPGVSTPGAFDAHPDDYGDLIVHTASMPRVDPLRKREFVRTSRE
jgi:hypothetical protein